MPFTKRALRNLCGKINREQAEDDVRKTMEVFQELGSKDQQLTYRVQADKEGWINNLMWANGNSRLQYTSLEMLSPLIQRTEPTCMTCHLVCLLE